MNAFSFGYFNVSIPIPAMHIKIDMFAHPVNLYDFDKHIAYFFSNVIDFRIHPSTATGTYRDLSVANSVTALELGKLRTD